MEDPGYSVDYEVMIKKENNYKYSQMRKKEHLLERKFSVLGYFLLYCMFVCVSVCVCPWLLTKGVTELTGVSLEVT